MEATEEIGRLDLLLFALISVAMGSALIAAALVKIARKRAPHGTWIGLAIVALTFCAVQYRLPSHLTEKSLQLFDQYRLAKYEKPANQTLLEIRRAHPDLRSAKKLDGEEMSQFLPANLPSTIKNARLFVFTSSDGLSDFALSIDTVYCRLNAGVIVSECGTIRTETAHSPHK